MNYIKPFNEAKDNWFNIKVSDILDFANNSHLAYLLDEGYIIDVIRPSGRYHREDDLLDYRSYIRIINLEGSRSVPKSWNEIKDYIIPFLRRFVNQFGLSNIDIEIEMGLNIRPDAYGAKTRLFKLEDVLNDKVKLDFLFSRKRALKNVDMITLVNWIKIKR
jgi:hypothetical protein